ncbi:MAG: hypothetical protein VX899_06975 [Myxococcota bacterium]|nr:hypothetical protein [Myxococcota bacterium]
MRLTPALPPERVAGYLRALATALDRLAPNEDWPPLSECLALLHALSPECSGPLLAPAELSVVGLPAYSWVSRVHAETVLAQQGRDESDTDLALIERAKGLDPELGDRVAGRRALHRFLRRHTVLPRRRLRGALRRRSPTLDIRLHFDHIDAQGYWSRICVDLRGQGLRIGPIYLERDGLVATDSGVVDLFMRHAEVPLLALHAQLEETLGSVTRLSRSQIGPFWFPGVALPDSVSSSLGRGLAMHVGTEVFAVDISQSYSQDPLHPELLETPEGMGGYRGRRVACVGGLVPEFQEWAASLGLRMQVVEI